MSTDRVSIAQPDGDDYRQMPLLELTSRIAEHGDTRALEEFHNHRTVFLINCKPTLFGQYITHLFETDRLSKRRKIDSLVMEKAYDQVVDKFLHLPEDEVSKTEKTAPMIKRRRRKRTDCRYYFRAYVRRAKETLASHSPELGPARREMELAALLCAFVYRHFVFSCLDCARRARRLETRYDWRIKNGTIRVWLPASLDGNKRRTWLEDNVPDPDASRPGEQDRVQEIVRDWLICPRIMSLTSLKGGQHDVASRPPIVVWKDWQMAPVRELADVVANEKVRRISEQRRSIQQMDLEQLKAMIRTIIRDKTEGNCCDGHIADSYGLDRSTYSRFGGSKWMDRTNGTMPNEIPDLWQNVACMVAGYPGFVEAAKSVGVWKTICTVLHRCA